MKDLKKYEGIIPAFYACYDKDGNRINENTLKTVVPLGQPGDTVRTVATATFDTARIEFVNY